MRLTLTKIVTLIYHYAIFTIIKLLYIKIKFISMIDKSMLITCKSAYFYFIKAIMLLIITFFIFKKAGSNKYLSYIWIFKQISSRYLDIRISDIQISSKSQISRFASFLSGDTVHALFILWTVVQYKYKFNLYPIILMIRLIRGN